MAAESLHGRIVTPGLALGPASDYSPGPGVYLDPEASCLRAAVAGLTHVDPAPPHSAPVHSATDTRRPLSVIRAKGSRPATNAAAAGSTATAARPRAVAGMTEALAISVGDIVLGRVTRINFKQASVDVLCVADSVLPDGFRGTIRTQDVRATEVDAVELWKSFAPGDVVRAQVISFGDRFSYFLSTASNHLGVIHAKGRSGHPMVPINWQQMRDIKTGTIEFRKLAKNAGPVGLP